MYPTLTRLFTDGLLDSFKEFNFNYSIKAPLINTTETETEFQLEVLAPKLEASDLKIEIEDGMIHLSTEKKWEFESKPKLLNEYSFHYTSRSFRIPENVNQDEITAKNENGLIVIHMPKKEVIKPTRKLIEIQ